MTVTERMKQGKTECARDPRTGEIVIRWSHYDPITEQDVPFSTRFHPRDYVTDAQLRSDYHLTTAQRNALGGYNEMTSRIDRWGYQVSTYWWKRKRVDAIVTSASGYQAELF